MPALDQVGLRLQSAYAAKRVCVTGGAGFIGGHLAAALLDIGATVSIIDDLSASDGSHAGGLVDAFPDRCRLYLASILDPRSLAEAAEGCTVVFHLAAMNSVPRSVEQPDRCLEVNTLGTLRVAKAAHEAGAQRLVLASSSSVYGDDPRQPKEESMLPRPLSPYGASKLAAEHIVEAWSRSFGLAGVCLRYFNVYGPRQNPDGPYAGVIPAFIMRLLNGEPPVIFGDGSQSRDFTHVSSVVRANLLAGAAEGVRDAQAINIGSGRRTTIREVASALAVAAGRPDLTPIYRDPRTGDVPHSLADLTRARALLGYEPVKGLEDGLRDTFTWFEHSSGRVAPTTESPR